MSGLLARHVSRLRTLRAASPFAVQTVPAASNAKLRARRRGARASVEIAKGYMVVAARGARPRARLTAPMPLATLSCAIAASPGR
jgi:hypothetical protein